MVIVDNCVCCRDIVVFIKNASRRHHNSLVFILELRWKGMVSDTTSWFDRCVRGTVNEINISEYFSEHKRVDFSFSKHQTFPENSSWWWSYDTWMGSKFHDLKQSPLPRNLRGTIQKIHVSKVRDPQTWKSMISAFQNIKNFKKTPLDDKIMVPFFLVSHVQNHVDLRSDNDIYEDGNLRI